MSRILVAIEGSGPDPSAVEEAVGLLGRDHTYEVLVVADSRAPTTAAVSVAQTGAAPIGVDASTVEELNAAAERQARQAGADIQQRLGWDGPVAVEIGDPATVICRTATEHHADLIMVGASSPGLLQRIFGGSVSDEVARHAPCAVLVMRHHDD
jgi:nucleotide-binding universal stress UspA family protein